MFKRILVPVDGSPTSTKALIAALQLAGDRGGQVRLVHALDELVYLASQRYPADVRALRDEAAKVLEDASAAAKAAGVESDTLLIDMPAQRLGESIDKAVQDWGADSVVIGTHGRRGIGRVLLGSGAEQIIRHARVPVLVIRAEEDAKAQP